MTKSDKNFIIACVLGDGCINQRIVNNTVQARFMLRHSNKQFDYFLWKVEKLKTILSSSQAKTFQKKSDYYYEDESGRSKILSVKFERNHPYFKILYRFIYQNKRKTFSRKVLDRLDPLGLAIWYMDDGSIYNAKYKRKDGVENYRSCTIRLNTYLSEKENEVIIKYFKDVWNINWYQEKEKKFYRLRCGKADEINKFFTIIKPFIIPSMLYKINIKIGQQVIHKTYPLPSNVEGEDIV